MKLYQRIEQILLQFHPVFSREATFEWFVLLCWGVMLSTQTPAVTSYLNALGLGESYYHQALHWFHSSAFCVDSLCARWGEWLSDHGFVSRLQGQRLYVGDGIKVGKEGRKMPEVKGLHQESTNVSKPEWIRGHYFSALGLLLGSGAAVFVVPIVFKLQDGIEAVDPAAPTLTLVDKMAVLWITHMRVGSYVLLDAYYGSANVLQPLQAHGLHLISRVRISTVAMLRSVRFPASLVGVAPANGAARFRSKSYLPLHRLVLKPSSTVSKPPSTISALNCSGIIPMLLSCLS